MLKIKTSANTIPLVENIDYYLENGYWVFTEHYHKKRGYCCGSGCRHCPYNTKRGKSTRPNTD